jgi:hypothetical protein
MSKAEKNKGGVKAWTSDEQKDWLTSMLPSYIASRASDSPSDFWDRLFEDWFEKWPIDATKEGDAISSEEKAKRKKMVSEIKRTIKPHTKLS